MRRLIQAVLRETKELLPVWLFMFLAFSLLRLTQSVVLKEYGFHSSTPSLVLLGSLIVAKSFFILDRFSFVERFRERPLIYSAIWKTGIYYVGAFVIFCLEQLIELSLKIHSMSSAWTRFSTSLGTPHFWVIQLWLVLLLFFFNATRETILAFGKQRFMSVWFGRSEPSSVLSPRKTA